MQIGDSYTWTPEAFEGEASGSRDRRLRRSRQVTGRVVWIHPQRRYFVVEAELAGHKLRECFPLAQKTQEDCKHG